MNRNQKPICEMGAKISDQGANLSVSSTEHLSQILSLSLHTT